MFYFGDIKKNIVTMEINKGKRDNNTTGDVCVVIVDLVFTLNFVNDIILIHSSTTV